jgi:hypothetical protein
MNRNQEKKKAERLVLSAARKAGAPIPSGELECEEPDFSSLAPDGSLGIEVTEVLRPRSSNHGISPVEAEAFHQSIMLKAQETFSAASSAPTRVSVYFSQTRGKETDKRELIDALCNAVTRNRERANPAVVLKGDELPEGFDHILITAESGEWWSGEGGGITLSEIRTEIGDKISAKNRLISQYRANLPKGARIWLLLYSRVTVSRSIPISYGIDEWCFPFGFDRVFWSASLENRVVEIRRAESAATILAASE